MSSLAEKRKTIINELKGMKRMRRGQLSEQFYSIETSTGETSRQGPYYVWQATIKGKKRSMRIKQQDVDQVREDVESYRRFKGLCDELADVTEQMTLSGSESKKKPRKRGKASQKK